MVGVGVGGGIGAGSINRVQQDDESNCGYVQSFALLVLVTGIIIGFIGLASDNDTMVIIGFVSFCLPFVLWFLSFVIVILGALLKVVMFGVSSIARGMDDGYLNIVAGGSWADYYPRQLVRDSSIWGYCIELCRYVGCPHYILQFDLQYGLRWNDHEHVTFSS